jgi:flagellar motor switch protein FliN/FliY
MSEGLAEFLQEIPVEVVVELGRARMTIGQLAALEPDEVIELDAGHADAVTLVVGGQVIARGETVVKKDRVALRIIEIVNNRARRELK